MFDMNKNIEKLKHVLENRPTEELLVIWIERDEGTWRPEVFGVIHDILVGRGVNPEEEKLPSKPENRESYRRYRQRYLDKAKQYREDIAKDPVRAEVERVRLAKKSARRRVWAKKFIARCVSLVWKSQCMDCGEGDVRVLEFDHTDDRERAVLTAAYSSIGSAKRELRRCDLVCCNCHRKRTFDRKVGNWALGWREHLIDE